jgi:hypothetical protein
MGENVKKINRSLDAEERMGFKQKVASVLGPRTFRPHRAKGAKSSILSTEKVSIGSRFALSCGRYIRGPSKEGAY